ncbi:MAG: hypothetical protein NC912_00905 [Candidatus Omnitrophica bacterium]|nr:hypothetical protein [Candidatus Omnitrophota bacterium]
MSPLRRKERMGELLLRLGLITAKQLQEALSHQMDQDKGKTVGQILLELGYITPENLCFVLGIQAGYPYIQIKNYKISREVLSLVPEEMVRKYQVFPLDKFMDFFIVAMVDPLDKTAVEALKDLTKANLMIFLTTPNELEEMYYKYYAKR